MFEFQTPSDVIEVRPDERFDEAKLAEFLHGKLLGTENPLAIKQFGGGAANLTYLLDYGTHEYVLRRPPLGPVAKSAHDMAREHRVLSVLWEVYDLAPRAYLYHADPELIGSDFFIMARKHGVVVRRKLPKEFASHEQATHRMSGALVDALARFHAVDYEAIGLGELGHPAGFISRQIEGWYKRWHKAKTDDLADMELLYEWLKVNQPPTTGFSLIHNDYKLDNVMLDAADPGRVIAIFDWDMCTLGDPLNDLGSLLAYWTEPTDPPYFQAMASMPLGDVGFMSRAEIVERYAESSGRDVSHINFYYALSLYRLTVILAQIYIRYVRGQTQDKRFASLGQVIPLVARAGKDVALGDMGIKI